MKILPFTIPVPHDHTIIVLDEVLPYFYTHLHRHEEIQLTWIMQGEGTLIAGNNIHPFKADEIYLLGPNLPHVFKSELEYFDPDSDKKVHTLTIFFNPYGQLESLFSLPEMKFIRSFLQNLNTGFKVPQHLFSEISGRMLSVQNAEGLDQLMQFLQLLKSFSLLNKLEPLTVNSYPRNITDSEGMRIGLIYNYIIQNFDKTITLEDVSDQAHMTPHAFCRYFKKHTRHTFVSFLNRIRINEACKMLNNNSDSIASVAYDCGFSSITNFNRVFKIVTGKSPSAYMLKYANSVE